MLGHHVKDKITHFEGIVVGRVEYITGCEQLLVQPVVKDDGTFVENRWFDVERVEVLAKDVVKLSDNLTAGQKKIGFDSAAPRK